MLFINPAVSDYFGNSVAELLGKDEFFFIEDDEAAEAIRANDRSIIQSGVAAVFEEPIVIDGNVRTFLSTKAPLRDVNGNILGIVGIGHDLTDRKLAEVALAERNQELDSFVHNVSHDLKAPLRAISNLSQWIEDDLEDRLPPDNQQQFQLLRTRVKRMESMIDSLLLYARAVSCVWFRGSTQPPKLFSTLYPPPSTLYPYKFGSINLVKATLAAACSAAFLDCPIPVPKCRSRNQTSAINRSNLSSLSRSSVTRYSGKAL